ncbi:MAG: PTS transporter subunit EIIC [Firmicutes bacterium]|nr:PTS transporter subunit EIIC [Bacillota bacterium]
MFEKEAKEILTLVGGSNNVNSLVHCATRLRFELKDNKKADKTALEGLSYVLSVVVSGGQFQVVIGPKVSSYFEEIMKIANLKKDTEKSGNMSILKIISGAFSPLIPIMAGAGMVKALLTVLAEFGIMSDASATYAVLSAAGNAVFYFMPIFLGITLSKQFGANAYVGGALGAALLEPSFTALIGQEGTNFFGIPLTAVDYATTIFPIFIISFIYAYLDKFLKKVIKQELQMFLVSMICIIVLVPLAALVFGPFGTTIGNVISAVVMKLFNFSGIVAGVVLGATYPFLTILGLHWGFTPITLQNITEFGGDVVEGAAACCVYAEIGIAIGAYLKGKKHSKIKEIAGPTLLTGFLAGVTEPILYGIIMRYKRLMIVVAIAGGVGGAINGLFGVTLDAFVFHNVFSMVMLTYSPFLPFLLGVAAALATGIILTYFWGITSDDKSDFEAVLESETANTTTNEIKEVTTNTVVTEKKHSEIFAPVSGTAIALENVEDEVFASGATGQGLAILPNEGKICAPFDGEVVAVFPSKHAVGLRSVDGVEMLIHVGLNTVMLNGKYFTLKIEQDVHVNKGDVLLEFDIENIKKEGYSVVTPVLVTNFDDVDLKVVANENDVLHTGDKVMDIN